MNQNLKYFEGKPGLATEFKDCLAVLDSIAKEAGYVNVKIKLVVPVEENRTLH